MGINEPQYKIYYTVKTEKCIATYKLKGHNQHYCTAAYKRPLGTMAE